METPPDPKSSGQITSANFIQALGALTSRGRVKWEQAEATEVVTASKDSFATSFVAEFQGKRLRISEISGPSESRGTIGLIISPQPRNRYRLDVLGHDGKSLYAFDEVSGLDRLFKVAAFKVAGIDDLMSKAIQGWETVKSEESR